MLKATDIISATELRQHLRERLRRVRESGRPLCITTNGKADAVILSPELFDALAEKAALVESFTLIERSAQDIQRGRTRQAKPALRQIAADLGITIDR